MTMPYPNNQCPFRSTQCDPFGFPQRKLDWCCDHRSSSRTETCIVTRRRLDQPMPSLWPGDLRTDGGSVAVADAKRIEA